VDCEPLSESCRSAPRHNPKAASARPPRWGCFFGNREGLIAFGRFCFLGRSAKQAPLQFSN
jgi:hypothetical protein